MHVSFTGAAALLIFVAENGSFTAKTVMRHYQKGYCAFLAASRYLTLLCAMHYMILGDIALPIAALLVYMWKYLCFPVKKFIKDSGFHGLPWQLACIINYLDKFPF